MQIRARNGIVPMLIASLLSTVMGYLLYRAHESDARMSSLAASFVRVLCSCSLVAIWVAKDRSAGWLWGDRRPALWLWGLSGAATVTTFFAAIQRIGMGEATFLAQASSGVAIALLTPSLARQSNDATTWLGLVGSLAGLLLMNLPETGAKATDVWGASFAIASGVFSSIAYLLVARTGETQHPITVMFYWCFTCVLVYLTAFLFVPVHFPSSPFTWTCVLGAGAAAALAQYGYTVAYQRGPAAPVTAVSYVAPVLALGVDAWAFALRPSVTEMLGAMIILGFGVALPFVRQSPRLATR